MIAIINYNMGNLGSIKNMLHRIGANAEVTSDLDIIRNADGLILPGVGSFDAAMKELNDLRIVSLLNELVLECNKPILGLCLGMQLFCQSSEEGKSPGFLSLFF